MELNMIIYTQLPGINRCLLFMLSLLASVYGYADDGEELVSIAIEKYAKAVLSRDIESILELVPDRGLSDADQLISRNQIRSELTDSNSYLYESIFDRSDIACRDEGGLSMVSDYTYFQHLGDYEKISVLKSEDIGLYTVNVPRLKVDGCEIWLFYMLFRIENEKAYFHGYFSH